MLYQLTTSTKDYGNPVFIEADTIEQAEQISKLWFTENEITKKQNLSEYYDCYKLSQSDIERVYSCSNSEKKPVVNSLGKVFWMFNSISSDNIHPLEICFLPDLYKRFVLNTRVTGSVSIPEEVFYHEFHLSKSRYKLCIEDLQDVLGIQINYLGNKCVDVLGKNRELFWADAKIIAVEFDINKQANNVLSSTVKIKTTHGDCEFKFTRPYTRFGNNIEILSNFGRLYDLYCETNK